MTRTIRTTMINTCVALAAVLCATVATSAPAAIEPAAAQPAAEIELDEIWVHGKSLSRRIEEAENKLFRRYNHLNKDHDYDVVCGFMSLDKGSMIMTRTCQPGFIADAVSNYSEVSMDDATNGRGCTSGNSVTAYLAGGSSMYWRASGCYFSSGASRVPSYSPGAQRISAAVTPERRQEYAKNFLKVTMLDTQLLEMSLNLAKLYQEMDNVQEHYVTTRKTNPPVERKLAPTAKAVAGPHAL